MSPTVDPPRARGRAALDRLVIVCFLGAIAAPLVDERVRPDSARDPRGREQRPASERPAFPPRTIAELGLFPERYTAWNDDRFGLRDLLIRAHSIGKIFVFGVSPTAEVIFGREGWLYYTGQRSIEVLRGTAPFPFEELEAWRLALESHRDWCAARGIEHLFVIGPNKESIYPEFLPDALNRVGPTRFDQLLEHLALRSDLCLLDLRGPLREDKANDGPENGTNYFPLGTHWTERGCLVAYRSIVERLLPRVPSLGRPLERSDFEAAIDTGPGDSWGRLLYVPDLLRQEVIAFQPKVEFTAIAEERVERGLRLRWCRKEGSLLPRAAVFHDSFGLGLEGWLPQHFSYWASVQDGHFDTRWIESETPDVVLEIFVERRLAVAPPARVDPRLTSRPAR